MQTGCGDSRVSFETEGGGAWPVWDRYLAIDGKRAYHLGNICQTCAFLFKRLEGANTSVEAQNTADELRSGVCHLSDPVIDRIGKTLPEDNYIAYLADIDLSIVRPGEHDDFYCKEQVALYGLDSFYDLPHDPRVPYYRAGMRDIGENSALFQFVVPMFPERWLKANVITSYEEQLKEGRRPTAVSVAVLDVKGPSDWDDNVGRIHEHWTLTHFLLDGHHKAAASRKAGVPLRLLSFLAVRQGVSDHAQVNTTFQALMA